MITLMELLFGSAAVYLGDRILMPLVSGGDFFSLLIRCAGVAALVLFSKRSPINIKTT